MKTSHLTYTMSLASILLVASCKPDSAEDPATTSSEGAAESASQLASYLLPEQPVGAISVSEAFAKPIPGTPVTISGEIMGQLNPFVEDRAMLVLGDPTKLTPCNRIPGDACETPWDACCDLPEVKKTATATIQILNADQRPLKQGLKGLGGMRELTTLTVVGTVAEGSNPENLLITASGIHVGQQAEL